MISLRPYKMKNIVTLKRFPVEYHDAIHKVYFQQIPLLSKLGQILWMQMWFKRLLLCPSGAGARNGAALTENLQSRSLKMQKPRNFHSLSFSFSECWQKLKNYHCTYVYAVSNIFQGHGVRSGFLDKPFLT